MIFSEQLSQLVKVVDIKYIMHLDQDHNTKSQKLKYDVQFYLISVYQW